MGQQQLLLIVLSVIIVGVAIAVGVTQFQSSAVDSNRQAVIADLVNLAAKAQRYYRTPDELGGGAQSFNGFALSTLEQSNANGTYVATVTAGGDSLEIVGTGTEIGNDGTNPLEVKVTVGPTTINTDPTVN